MSEFMSCINGEKNGLEPRSVDVSIELQVPSIKKKNLLLCPSEDHTEHPTMSCGMAEVFSQQLPAEHTEAIPHGTVWDCPRLHAGELAEGILHN